MVSGNLKQKNIIIRCQCNKLIFSKTQIFKNYDDEIFNSVKETALKWKVLPRKIVVSCKEEWLASGYKVSLECLTLLEWK